MRRRAIVWLISGLVLVVFLVVSALLARVFSADSAERSAITSLLRDEANGNTNAVIGDIKDCSGSASCRTLAATNATKLKAPGALSILILQSAAGGFSFTNTEGVARVAWRIGTGLPIVQCIRVRRSGNPITGLHVELLDVTRRIPSESNCPASF